MPALEKQKQENQMFEARKKKSGLFYILKCICAEVDAFGEAEAGGSPYITEK